MFLAESKSKGKWSSNPNGNHWAKDENKFGQKLLMKMGWKPGTGLGAKNQGITKIIKLKMKNDTKGLGKKEMDADDNSAKVLVDYDNILAELGGVSKNTIGGDDVKKELQSLEEKSKASRTRIHYHKFTRGKDVTKYSSKDLNCILSLSAKERKKDKDDQVESGTNMYDYFKDKVKNPYINKQLEIENGNTTESEYCNNLNGNEQEFKQIKKRKNRDIEIGKVNNDNGIPRKRKNIESEEDNNSNGEENYEVGNQCEKIISEDTEICKKIKKKKKKIVPEKYNSNEVDGEDNCEVNNQCEDIISEDTQICNKIIKKKKKKKIVSEEDNNSNEANGEENYKVPVDNNCEEIILEDTQLCNKTKKKKKK